MFSDKEISVGRSHVNLSNWKRYRLAVFVTQHQGSLLSRVQVSLVRNKMISLINSVYDKFNSDTWRTSAGHCMGLCSMLKCLPYTHNACSMFTFFFRVCLKIKGFHLLK
jgi:hypothetical protein